MKWLFNDYEKIRSEKLFKKKKLETAITKQYFCSEERIFENKIEIFVPKWNRNWKLMSVTRTGKLNKMKYETRIQIFFFFQTIFILFLFMHPKCNNLRQK